MAIEWISKNGIWKVHIHFGKWMIENLKTGFGDGPFQYDGRWTFDRPEEIPRYVKNQFAKMAFEEMDY